jgi:hypothetical protein
LEARCGDNAETHHEDMSDLLKGEKTPTTVITEVAPGRFQRVKIPDPNEETSIHHANPIIRAHMEEARRKKKEAKNQSSDNLTPVS